MSSSVPVQLPPGFISRNYGAELMASFAATALWGIQCLQTFFYFQVYTSDPWPLKSLIAWIWIMDTVHQGLIITLEYQTLIAHFGDPGPIFVINPELISSILFTVLVSVPTQIFFVYRIYILSQKKIILPAFLVLCIIGETVIAILYVGFSLSPKTTIQDLLTANNLVGRLGPTMMIIAAFIDVVIATSMVYFLRKTKVEALSNTQRIVLRLIIYSVNTGLWTAFLAIAVAVTTFTNGETFIPIGLYIPISALYCNTLLANLNIRQHVRKGLQDVITLSIMTPHTASSAAQDQDHFAVRVARSTSTFTYGNNTEDSHRKKLQTDV